MTDGIVKRALRFGLTGMFATAIHVFIAVLAVELLNAHPSIANGLAFCVATIFAYIINTKWSFSSQIATKTIARYAVVSVLGLVAAMLISGIADYAGLHYMLGIVFVVVAVPVLTFLMHNFWTFKTA